MKYKIGEVSKFLGISADTIRYYEKEGIINPGKNIDNGYRVYSFEDIFRLSDILFYRDVELNIREIREITNGISTENLLSRIQQRKEDVHKYIDRYQKLLLKIENWEKLHSEALKYLNKFEIRPMPKGLRKQRYENKESIDAQDLFKSTPVSPGYSFFATLSFSCCIPNKDIRYYFALDEEVSNGLDFSFNKEDYVEEGGIKSLFTVCQYDQDFLKMLTPLISYAANHELHLDGRVFGRQSIVTYHKEKTLEFYRIYAPIK